MSSYTTEQYEQQRRITATINEANARNRCPVCRLRPQATWPTGVRRMTCGHPECYVRWLRVRPESKEDRNE
jgi:hypothetical protein